MTVSISTLGPYYTSGSITFSSLRDNFRGSDLDNLQIKASELIRNTNTLDTNPIVPDATENLSISSSSNLKLSQFRNSIKSYNITQSDTDINFDITSLNWNNNLNKNILKRIFINGICGTNATTQPAATFNATAYNLTIDVSGEIYGAGGQGGNSSSISGGSGGNALFVQSSGGNNVVVFVRSTAKIYGGGGGGEKGLDGSRGTTGNCINYSYYERTQCRSCPNCNSGDTRLFCFNREGRCQRFYQTRRIRCQVTNVFNVIGGSGGIGGNGGPGRGYNNFSGSLNGSLGTVGQTGSCTGYNANGSPIPGNGQNGENGGAGGEWGFDGNSTNNTASGGSSGRSIFGSNYIVQGSINSSTIKGAFR